MLDHALAARHPREHFAFARDGFRRRVPGCSSDRELQAHHVRWRSAGGGDEDWNLVALCAFHRLRGIDARTIRVTGRAPEERLFELALRAGLPPLARFTEEGSVSGVVWETARRLRRAVEEDGPCSRSS